MRSPAAGAVAGVLLSAVPVVALDPGKRITQYTLDTWSARDGAPAGTITAIAQTPDGYLWLGTGTDGLVRFDGVRFERVTALDEALDRPHASVNALVVGRDGSLWVGANAGLARLQAGQFSAPLKSAVCGLAEGPTGTVWVTLCWEGLAWVREGKVSRLNVGGWWTAVACDTVGNVWTNSEDGLLRARESAIIRFASTVKAGASVPEADLVRAGGSDMALLSGRALGTIHAIWTDREGSVWVSTRAGLIRLQNGRVTGRINARDGLSSDEVNLAFKDRDGNLWVGTGANGLNLRRGAGYEVLTKTSGLSHDSVTAIYEDREGNLWVGAQRGLNRLKDGIFTPWGAAEGLGGSRTASVLESRDGAIWAWSDGGGLTEIRDGRTRVYTTRDGLARNFGGPLFESRDGSLWIGHDRGVSRFKDGRATAFQQGELASRYVGGLTEDAEGMIFSVWGIGCRRWNGHSLQPLPPAESSVLGRSEAFMTLRARDGSRWLATTSGAVVLRDGTARVVYKVPQDSVTSAFEDSGGVIWLTTLRNGVVHVGKERLLPITSAEGLFEAPLGGMVEDRKGYFWFASRRGIFRVQRSQLMEVAAGTRKRVECAVFGLADGMRSLEAMGAQPGACAARDGRLWFVTSEGLVVADPDRMRRNTLPPPVVIESVVVDGVPMRPATGVQLAPGRERFEVRYNGLSLVAPEKVRFKYRLEGYDSDWVEAGPRRVAYYTKLPPGQYGFRVIATNDDGVWNTTGATFAFRVKPRFHETWWFAALTGSSVALGLVGVHRLRLSRLRIQRLRLERLVSERTRELQSEVAERRRTEGALREERTMLDTVLDRIPDNVYFKDAESRFSRVNLAMAGWLGLADPKDAVGKTDFDFFGPEHARQAFADEAELMRTGAPLAGREEKENWPDGRVTWVHTTKMPLRDAHGCIVGTMGISRDITARKQEAEAALSRAEEKYQAMFENAIEGIYQTTPDGRFLTANPAMAHMLGYESVEELAAATASVADQYYVSPERRLELQRRLEERGTVSGFEIELRRRDGTRIWVSMSGRAVRDLQGQLLYYEGRLEDVTARKRAEDERERLRAAVEKAAVEWARTFDATETPILIMDAAGRLTRLNRAAAELAGGTPRALVGARVAELGAAEPWRGIAELGSEVARSGSHGHAEARDAEGGRTWDLTADRLPSPAEGKNHVIVVARDVTRLIELQNSLRRSETMSALGMLVAGVAHEVRNPLFAISANLDTLEARSGASPDTRPMVALMRSEVERLASLMRDLLEYGRPAPSARSPDSVDAVVAEAVQACASLAQLAGVTLVSEVAPGLPQVLMDRRRLVQVFQNLLQNAVQHSPAGGVVLVAARPEPVAGELGILVTVSDSGPGIDPGHLARIFEPFFSRRRGGTGLGLAIAQRIVEEHGGMVSAANRPEGGAVMQVRLPASGRGEFGGPPSGSSL